MNVSPVAQLQNRYQSRLEGALAQSRPVAAFTSNTVPWEILSAAGFYPLLLSPARGATTHADIYMEETFDGRTRGIFEHLLTGEWRFIDTLIIPRTSEQEHKLFLYLREVARQEPQRKLPKVHLYNLLHARTPEARVYGLERTRELVELLPPASKDSLHEAIAQSNAARAAVRSLLSLRPDRLSGADVLELIGAFYFMDRAEYAALATAAAHELASRPAHRRPRILVKGSPVDHCHLHRAIEDHGAVVWAEDDWWGSRAAGVDIQAEIDPIEAIFEKYYLDAPSPRVFPQAAADEWFLKALDGTDGVVFYVPPEDAVFGWDYPRLRAVLNQRGIPHLLIRADASAEGLSAECHEEIETFVARVKDRDHG